MHLQITILSCFNHRPGVEVAVILILESKSVLSFVEERLNNHNKSGVIGSMRWVGVSWMLEGMCCWREGERQFWPLF